MNKEINWNDISRERKAKIAKAINSFGDNAHPMAEATNLESFDTTYVMQCVMSGVEYNERKFSHEPG